MRFNRFDLNLLVVLDALLTERNITRAGEKVFLSQSATSGALARLREYFDDQLLVQVGRKMILTPLGESLIVPVRELLMKVQITLDARPDIDISTTERRLSMVMSDYPVTVLMPEVWRRAAEIAPGITFETMSPSNSPQDELEQGNIDFLLLPSEFLLPEHPSIKLFDEDFVVMCWDQNPDIGDSISREQYLQMGHVMVQFGTKRRPSVDAWMTARGGIERRAEVIVNTFTAVPQCLVGTRRIATIHRRLAETWAQYLPLKILEAPLEIPPFSWGLQWHQIQDLDPVNRWMRELMLDVSRELDQARKQSL
ncbi:LysR family transcriptional regulator [Parathalassolituus penaei]|uniref:LysR family transcriptional regulator n=1 Tax=Parathalassolituus penaei TaxID=2997323 RepID=A0A9X3IUL3_9GAMM|nr:LysR family transcriptional regulator [Parathalassolituus penaei]MCY0966293.1 LysR family transcriptional regulator [Parathalassolituus penaei]